LSLCLSVSHDAWYFGVVSLVTLYQMEFLRWVYQFVPGYEHSSGQMIWYSLHLCNQFQCHAWDNDKQSCNTEDCLWIGLVILEESWVIAHIQNHKTC
jgi:hypothetical protein